MAWLAGASLGTAARGLTAAVHSSSLEEKLPTNSPPLASGQSKEQWLKTGSSGVGQLPGGYRRRRRRLLLTFPPVSKSVSPAAASLLSSPLSDHLFSSGQLSASGLFSVHQSFPLCLWPPYPPVHWSAVSPLPQSHGPGPRGHHQLGSVGPGAGPCHHSACCDLLSQPHLLRSSVLCPGCCCCRF